MESKAKLLFNHTSIKNVNLDTVSLIDLRSEAIYTPLTNQLERFPDPIVRLQNSNFSNIYTSQGEGAVIRFEGPKSFSLAIIVEESRFE